MNKLYQTNNDWCYNCKDNDLTVFEIDDIIEQMNINNNEVYETLITFDKERNKWFLDIFVNGKYEEIEVCLIGYEL